MTDDTIVKLCREVVECADIYKDYRRSLAAQQSAVFWSDNECDLQQNRKCRAMAQISADAAQANLTTAIHNLREGLA